ncbi:MULTISPECIES: ABC transporter ATP-binding protein [Streptomyces]|uniref:ABC transporter ATP-binding protein n=1 Tax=Streptomyces TaxID=1883 RepID=UPI001072A8D9|nr:ABC transporter ATP-binding protein [Streptomyces sp. 4R-3d]TFI25374.1 ABC transporter ATP-binding protein [Streptomyces sp. 4R-3d]
METAEPLLDVAGLRVVFPGADGPVHAVDGVDLRLAAGQCLAVVGESGSGKSVTARALLGLAGPTATVTADRLRVAGQDLVNGGRPDWRALRGRSLGMVLQDAMTSLDPLRTVGAEIAEPLRNQWHSGPRRLLPAGRAVRERVLEQLRAVQVPEPGIRARQYPHQLSGGLRQRALIAAALVSGPPVLLADEPTTALDVTVQARILDLLAAQRAAGTAILLISHDLAVVGSLADRIAVMYRGRFVEEGPAAQLLTDPAHPYTRTLLDAVPSRRPRGARLSLPVARTEPERSGGCDFAHRCPLVEDGCRTSEPARHEVTDGHSALCRRLGVPLPRPADTAAAPTRPVSSGTPLLEAKGLTKSFPGPGRSRRTVVRDVSFSLYARETLAVVGESGSGKTTTAQLALGLLEPDAGWVRLRGEPWSGVPERTRRAARRRLQHVQQDPLSSFDPRYTVERVVAEAFGTPDRGTVRRQLPRIGELLESVGLDPALRTRRPGELSGGQRQRVAIARALATDPELLVCDEPVSALDVSVQGQILDLFRDVQQRTGVALLFISHDLGVVGHVADRVLVMREGELVESGRVDDVFGSPAHPYTRSLLSALPRLPEPEPEGPRTAPPRGAHAR